MPRENQPQYVNRDEVDEEVNMGAGKMDYDGSDDDVPPNRRTNSQHSREPIDEDAPKPFVPYCKKNLAAQQTWPLYLQRAALREYFAEFLGTFVLILFGNGVVAMKVFQSETYDIQRDAAGNVISHSVTPYNQFQSNASYLCIAWGWGMGLTMALFVSGKISGGHLNPAVTLSSAIFGQMPWVKVPFYIILQILGAMTAAACVYGLYKPFFDTRREIVRLDQAAGSTVTDTDALGGIFCTYPVNDNYKNVYCFWSELLNSIMLMFLICGVGDEEGIPMQKNANARRRTALKLRLYQQNKEAARRERTADASTADLNEKDYKLIEEALATEKNTSGYFFMTYKPIAVGLIVFELGIATGWNSGYAINPARDLGPRLVSAMIFGSTDPFTKRDYYFWIPMFVPILGCVLGQLLYTLFIIPEVVKPTELDDYEEKQLFLAKDSA